MPARKHRARHRSMTAASSRAGEAERESPSSNLKSKAIRETTFPSIPEARPVRGWFHGVAAAGIVLVAILAFGNNLHGKLVLDDQAILEGNHYIQSLKNIPKLFTLNWWGMTNVSGAGTLYRPLAATSFAVDVALMGGYSPALQQKDRDSGGYDVRVLHASSIFYHIVASFFVYLVLLRLLSGERREVWALVGALLFAAHPVHVEAVSSHVGRAEVLGGMFFFAGAAAFLCGTRSGSKGKRLGWSIGAAVLWLSALLSKEMAATLPIFLVFVEWMMGRRGPFREWVARYSPFVVAGMIYAVMREVALGDQTLAQGYLALPPSTVPYGARLMTMTHALAYYWKLVVFPVSFTPDYSGFPVTRSAASPVFWGSLFLHAAILGSAVWAFRGFRRGKGNWLCSVGLGLTAFYILIFPVSNILINTGVVISERALYIPTFGPILAFVALLQYATSRIHLSTASWVPYAAGGALVVAGIAGCRIHNRAWADEAHLFSAAVRNPYSGHIAYSGMSRTLYIQGKYEESLKYAERSVAMRPTVINLGREVDCLIRLKRYEQALKPLNLLLLNQGTTTNLRKLVNCYVNLGRGKEALALLEKYPTLSKSPDLQAVRRRLEESRPSKP